MAKSSTANRGLKFEEEIQKRCDYLRKEGIALISKVPTDWKVLRKYSPIKKKSEIYQAFPVAESKFVDFVGLIGGRAIGIEAKETLSKTSFPFNNIKDTQIEFLKEWVELGGLGYYMVRFKTNEKVFLVPSEVMHECMDTIGRKSAPYQWFIDNTEIQEVDYKLLDFEKNVKIN